ncbi:hypothetical protein SARC_13939 [Sphaeroforma arctica JP610]|uniref:Uncharacterized protein n=1 Tax=Sphaeroforma arctica JP610 TaxID=667725 RepID=A0A0L0F9V8_9EUKA|nr:hypothetical protein SARC_13939 [Sphaeroforma arctica JP610]KNC73504.1 hypothetical protein SARC_13939 [Sphaeroforma arctica JP610]|eukprot:XP_014147406.1 hypothetical protein SARC_13939 [Sphaeroforma arctica JP610]
MASSPSLEFLSPINLQSPAQSPQPLRNTLDDGQSMDRNTDREPSTSVASEKSSDLYPGSVSITATLNGISVDKTRDAAIDKDHIGTDSGKSAYEFVRYGEVDRNRKYIYEDEDNSDFTAIAETRSINSLGLEPTQVHTQHTEISIASGSSTNTNRADSKHDAHNKVSCMSGSQLLKKQTSKSHLHTVTQTNSPAYAYQSLDFEPYTGPPTAPKRHNTLPEIQPQATRTTKVRTETRSPPQAYLQTLASEHSSVLSPTPQLGDSDVLLGSGPDYSMDNRSASNDIIPMSTVCAFDTNCEEPHVCLYVWS